MILGDEWFGHRNVITGHPQGDKDDKLDWDFALIQAFQIIEAYTDQDGLTEWTKNDPTVRIEADKKINPFRAVTDSITQAKNYKPAPGQYFVPRVIPKNPNGEPMTYQEWREAEKQKYLDSRKDGKLG